METAQSVTLLPPDRPARWRTEYVTFFRRHYETLDRWAAETGQPIGVLVRQAIDEAVRRRGFVGDPVEIVPEAAGAPKPPLKGAS